MEPKLPESKSEILEKTRTSRRAFDDLLAQIPENRMIEPGAEEDWSIKDILAHITVWEQRMLGWIQVAVEGLEPEMPAPGLTWEEVDELNAATYAAYKEQPLDEVIKAYLASYEQALEVLQAYPEEALMKSDYFTWRQGRPLSIVVAANTYWHYDEHLPSLQQFLAKL